MGLSALRVASQKGAVGCTMVEGVEGNPRRGLRIPWGRLAGVESVTEEGAAGKGLSSQHGTHGVWGLTSCASYSTLPYFHASDIPTRTSLNS